MFTLTKLNNIRALSGWETNVQYVMKVLKTSRSALKAPNALSWLSDDELNDAFQLPSGIY